MTLEERVAALEDKTRDIHRSVNDEGTVPIVEIDARVGIFSNFWARKPLGQGAALGIGTNVDRYGIYAEIDEISCPDHPSTAIAAHCVAPNPYRQKNIAFEGHAANSPVANVVLVIDGQGFEVAAGVSQVLIGQLGGILRPLWP